LRFHQEEETMRAQQIISTHPQVKGQINDVLIRCIEQCYDCAQTCTSCADACLGETMVQQLTQCIRLNLDCADVCTTTGRMATRRTGSNDELIAAMLSACETACRMCAAECRKNAGQYECCAICAEACESCQQSCAEARGTMGARH
jgi:hypothetical protein